MSDTFTNEPTESSTPPQFSEIAVQNMSGTSASSDRTVTRRSGSLLDQIAGFFWAIVNFFLLFFQSMFNPKGGAFKPAAPQGRRPVRGVHGGGGGPPSFGGGGMVERVSLTHKDMQIDFNVVFIQVHTHPYIFSAPAFSYLLSGT